MHILKFLIGGQNEEMDDGLVFRCSCTKLVVSETSASPQGDILGLWHGNYGPHGTEIINVTQTNEEVVGIKVLGIKQSNIYAFDNYRPKNQIYGSWLSI
jgi:hypothetical protein